MIYIKKEIEENYNIKVDKIYKSKDENYFFVNDKKIYIKRIDKTNEENLNELVKFTNYLYSKNKPTETFLINKQGKYTIEYKNKKIALLIANNAENIVLNYNDIMSGTFKIENYVIKKYNMYNEWKKIIDDFEKRIVEYNKEYPLIMKYANYYIGLAENAIQLLGETKIKDEKEKYLGRLTKENKYNYKNYMDPFSYVETLKLYDVANYFKYKLYTDEIDYDELEMVKKNLEDEDDKKIFTSIIVFPIEVFKRMDKIMQGQMEEKTIIEYIKKIKKIEEFMIYIQEKIVDENYIKWLEDE